MVSVLALVSLCFGLMVPNTILYKNYGLRRRIVYGYASAVKLHFSKMLSVTLTFESMTLKT